MKGEWVPPGDKSISHRAVMLGALAKGETLVRGFLEGDDCLHTIQAFKAMGVCFSKPKPGELLIHGVGKYGLSRPNQVLDCGNSGTTIRLLSGLLAAQAFDVTLTGDASLQKRPMARVALPLSEMGAKIETTNGCAPLYITGNPALSAIDYTLKEASAQVKSCVLLAGMYANGETIIHEPIPTRNHTEAMLKAFGYPIQIKGQAISIQNSGEYEGTAIEVPGDLSSAAFFIVAATLIPGSDLIIRNVGLNPTRRGIIDILQKMGASLTVLHEVEKGGELIGDLRIRHAKLTGIDIPPHLVSLAIDEFPILLIAASQAEGETRISEASELRYKESDRIAVMIEGLNRSGIKAEAFPDGALVSGGILEGGAEIESFGDHRIAMAFSVAGALSKKPITIRDCSHIATSFPTFLKDANALGLNIQEEAV